ncbi:hypothetical protein GCM10009540_04700 [Streptomyces turgidiscabies]
MGVSEGRLPAPYGAPMPSGVPCADASPAPSATAVAVTAVAPPATTTLRRVNSSWGVSVMAPEIMNATCQRAVISRVS